MADGFRLRGIMVGGLECFQLSKNTRQQSEKWSSHTAITVIRT